MKGAAGLFFDKGIFHFGRYVEAEVEMAGQDAISPAFARSAQQRAFSRCMGDDMSMSTVGFADPFADAEYDAPEDQILVSGY